MVKQEVLDNFEMDEHTRNDDAVLGTHLTGSISPNCRSNFKTDGSGPFCQSFFFVHFFVTPEFEQSNDERKRHLDLRKRRRLKHLAQVVVEVSSRGQEQAWAANVEHAPVCWRVCWRKIGVMEWSREVDG